MKVFKKYKYENIQKLKNMKIFKKYKYENIQKLKLLI